MYQNHSEILNRVNICLMCIAHWTFNSMRPGTLSCLSRYPQSPAPRLAHSRCSVNARRFHVWTASSSHRGLAVLARAVGLSSGAGDPRPCCLAVAPVRSRHTEVLNKWTLHMGRPSPCPQGFHSLRGDSWTDSGGQERQVLHPRWRRSSWPQLIICEVGRAPENAPDGAAGM